MDGLHVDEVTAEARYEPVYSLLDRQGSIVENLLKDFGPPAFAGGMVRAEQPGGGERLQVEVGRTIYVSSSRPQSTEARVDTGGDLQQGSLIDPEVTLKKAAGVLEGALRFINVSTLVRLGLGFRLPLSTKQQAELLWNWVHAPLRVLGDRLQAIPYQAEWRNAFNHPSGVRIALILSIAAPDSPAAHLPAPSLRYEAFKAPKASVADIPQLVEQAIRALSTEIGALLAVWGCGQ